MNKKIILIIAIPILIILTAYFGLDALCSMMDNAILENIMKNHSTGEKQALQSRKLTSREQCDTVLTLMDILNKDIIDLEEFGSAFSVYGGLELPGLRQLLLKLGYSSFRMSGKHKQMLLNVFKTELKNYTKQDFGTDTAKWREFLNKSIKLSN